MRDQTKRKKKAKGLISHVAKELHAQNRPSLIQSLFNRSFNQLINDFIVEMDCKNEAYYFILENGHFDSFKNYCQTKKILKKWKIK